MQPLYTVVWGFPEGSSKSSVLSSQMPLHVQREMVTPGEGTFTEVALEWTVTSVLSVVPGQFIGASELPAAALPVAVVWLLPSVST